MVKDFLRVFVNCRSGEGVIVKGEGYPSPFNMLWINGLSGMVKG